MKKKSIAIFLAGTVATSLIFSGCGSKGSEARTPRPEGVPADYPNKTIEIAHGFAPGSQTESFVRLVMENIQENEGWDYGFTIGFHEGDGGGIGWAYTANAEPDGYTLGIVQGTAMIRPISRGVTDWGLDKFSYICNMMTDPGAIAVKADSPYNNLTDLVNAALENPGQISVGCGGLTSSDGLAIQQVELATGCDFNIMPVGDSEAVPMVLGGFLDCAWLNLGDFTSYVETGEVKIIATGDSERAIFAPDVETFMECGVDVKQANARCICGPAGMDEDLRQYLEDCWINAMNDPELQEKAENLQIPYQIMTGEETYAFMSDLTATLQEQWGTAPWE